MGTRPHGPTAANTWATMSTRGVMGGRRLPRVTQTCWLRALGEPATHLGDSCPDGAKCCGGSCGELATTTPRNTLMPSPARDPP